MKQQHSKLTKVMVATDLSHGSQHALERALILPLAAESEVHLLHVLPAEMPLDLRTRAEELIWSKLQDLSAAATKPPKRAASGPPKITSEISQGEPYIEIIRAAESFGAELVVMGRYGMRGVRRLLIGSTAMRVIRRSNVPVLVVSQQSAGKYARPLVAVDLKDAPQTVIQSALEIVDPALRSVPVVHAYWPPFEGSVLAKLSPKQVESYHRGLQQQAESALKNILATLPDKGARCKPVVLRGDPRSVVLEEATRRRSDLIAVGTHARTGLSHALLGSVAEWHISHARCDVLVARPARDS